MLKILSRLLFLALLAGCLPRHAPKAYYKPTDPALPGKLGIAPWDWRDLQDNAKLVKGYVIKDVGAVSPDEIWIEFKLPTDLSGTKGGPIYYYNRFSSETECSGWSFSEADVGTW
jgi:hypothetical protein